MGSYEKQKAAAGFTLIELLIVITVVAILSAVAIPSYTEYVRRGNRADAKSQMLQLSNWMQQRYSINNVYPTTTQFSALPSAMRQSPAGSGTAKFAITLSARTDTSYTIQAAPTGGYSDPTCGTLTIDNTGLRMVNGSTTSTLIEKCWNK